MQHLDLEKNKELIKKYVSLLPMDHLGLVPNNRKVHYYRVESWGDGFFIADFALKGEAESFAIEHARENGYRYDHKVCPVTHVK